MATLFVSPGRAQPPDQLGKSIKCAVNQYSIVVKEENLPKYTLYIHAAQNESNDFNKPSFETVSASNFLSASDTGYKEPSHIIP